MLGLINKIILKILTLIFFLLFLSKLLFANNFYDYPMFFLVDACQITQQRYDPNNLSQSEILKGREKYSTCMNFILSLSTTLNLSLIHI